MGLLDDLRREASDKLSQNRENNQGSLERLAIVESAMHQTFSYLNDLCKQLNILTPTSGNALELQPQIVFNHLKIDNFSIDRRAKKIMDRECISQIIIGFIAQNEQKFQITKELAQEINRTNDFLRDAGVKFTKNDKRGDRNLVTHAVFDIDGHVRSNIHIEANYEHAEIKFRLRNIDRIGTVEFLFAANSISETKLEEFAKLLLGQANNFRSNQLPPRL